LLAGTGAAQVWTHAEPDRRATRAGGPSAVAATAAANRTDHGDHDEQGKHDTQGLTAASAALLFMTCQDSANQPAPSASRP
jgi:hypothetical protein